MDNTFAVIHPEYGVWNEGIESLSTAMCQKVMANAVRGNGYKIFYKETSNTAVEVPIGVEYPGMDKAVKDMVQHILETSRRAIATLEVVTRVQSMVMEGRRRPINRV